MAGEKSTATAASEQAASTGLTGVLANVGNIGEHLERLQAENAGLKAENAQLRDDVTAAEEARDEVAARAARLAEAVDAGEPVEREPGDVRERDLVFYRLVDVVTGDPLEGAGIVVSAGNGGLTVAPVSSLYLTLVPEAVQVIPAKAQDD